MKDLSVEMPVRIELGEDATDVEKEAIHDTYKEEIKDFVRRKSILQKNMVKAYGLIWGQCTKGLRAKLEARQNWDDGTTEKIKHRPINLLKAIKEITHNHQDTKYPQESIFFSIRNVFTMKQEDNEGLTEYTKRFNNAIDIMETQHGMFSMTAYLKTRTDFQLAEAAGDAELKKTIHKQQYDRLKAFVYLRSLDGKKSGKLVEDLNNQYALGNNQFPATVTKATETVLAYRNRVNQQQNSRNRGGFSPNVNNRNNNNNNNRNNNDTAPQQNVSFGQKETTTAPDWKKHIRCYNCNEKGHLSNECPKKQKGNQGSSHVQWSDQQNDNGDDNTFQSHQSHVQWATTEGPSNNNTEVTFQASAFTLETTQQSFQQLADGPEEMRKWILLDTGSSTDIFCDDSLLSGVSRNPTNLTLHTNGGILQSNQKGELPIYGKVWHDERALTNILSFFNLQKKFHVTFDNRKDDSFHVYTKDGKEVRFSPSPNGIYRYDNANKDFCFTETVASNSRHFTKRQIENAKAARKLYHAIGAPSTRDFRLLLRSNMIRNCPVTEEDVRIAEKVFGKDIATLKGKSVRTKPIPGVSNVVKVPKALKREHRNIELCVDIMYIQGLTFLTTISKRICYRTIEYIPDRSKDSICTALDNVFRIYNVNRFVVTKMRADPEFEMLRDVMLDLDIELECCSAQEHVPEIERSIRVIKERFRTLYHRLPFNAIPKVMVKVAAMECVKWLNSFPPRTGVSDFYSPRAIVTGRPIDYNRHCKTAFGSYVQALHETNPTNTTAPRTIGCIYLRSTDDKGYQLLNLSSKHVITRRKYTEIPTPQNVIDRVEQLAQQDGMKPDLHFLDRKGNLIRDDHDFIAGVESGDEDDNDDDNSESETDDSDSDDDEPDDNDDPDAVVQFRNNLVEYNDDEIDNNNNENDDEIDNNNNKNDDDAEAEDNPEPIQQQQPQPNDNENDPHAITTDEDIPEENETTEPEPETEPDDATEATEAAPTEPTGENIDLNADEDQPTDPQPRRSTRVSKPVQAYKPTLSGKSYDAESFVAQVMNRAVYDDEYALMMVRTITELRDRTARGDIGVSFAETFSLSKGYKVLGDSGRKAAFNEVDQLHKRGVFEPINPSKLSKAERAKVLESLIFLTQKRDGSSKARTCVNGSPQRLWMNKEEAASPTVLLESVLLTSVIDARENREVATVDIPNAFVQTDMDDEKVVMKMRGKLAELLVQVAPEIYREYVVIERGQKVLYLELRKALYGMLKSALLFYKKLRSDLESIGFKVNPYDPCVANLDQGGSQLTVVWHVDDLKISHRNKAIVDDFIHWVKSKYEEEGVRKVKESRGKIHDYLGMDLDFSTKGEVQIKMQRYVEEMLGNFSHPNDIRKEVTSPASENLFRIDESSKLLESDRAQSFHTTVAKGLFLCKRARPDIMTAIAFLCTRVREPTEEDWLKLLRLMRYLNGTKQLFLTLSANDSNVVKWYGDASFAIHDKMKSHTGGTLTLGSGGITNVSRKQKMVSKSSMEAELIAADDLSNSIIWTNYFLEAQGYASKDTILFQDNKSCMLLHNNGKSSSSKRTRHLNIRYYFLSDRIANGELRVEYCPTDNMIADYFTKPLQGDKFRKFRKIIMNLKD